MEMNTRQIEISEGIKFTFHGTFSECQIRHPPTFDVKSRFSSFVEDTKISEWNQIMRILAK